MVPLGHYLFLSAILFAIGTMGVFLRRNVITVLLVAELAWALSRAARGGETMLASGPGADPAALQSVRALGNVLFTEYSLAFEVTSILIIVAMIGAVVLAKRES